MSLSTASTRLLNTSTASLGSLFQCLVTLPVNKFNKRQKYLFEKTRRKETLEGRHQSSAVIRLQKDQSSASKVDPHAVVQGPTSRHRSPNHSCIAPAMGMRTRASSTPHPNHREELLQGALTRTKKSPRCSDYLNKSCFEARFGRSSHLARYSVTFLR